MVRCPYNDVASFIYRYKKNNDIKILEIGSGDGNNLWYLKNEGFNIKGLELDCERINNAKNRLMKDNYHVDIINQDFIKEFPFNNSEFDLIFDRAAITCVSYDNAIKVISNIHKVLKKGGYFYFNPYSELDPKLLKGSFMNDGRVRNLKNGFEDYEGICFYSIKDILNMFKTDQWEIKEFNLITRKEIIESRQNNVSTFEVIVKKL